GLTGGASTASRESATGEASGPSEREDCEAAARALLGGQRCAQDVTSLHHECLEMAAEGRAELSKGIKVRFALPERFPRDECRSFGFYADHGPRILRRTKVWRCAPQRLRIQPRDQRPVRLFSCYHQQPPLRDALRRHPARRATILRRRCRALSSRGR